MSRPEPVEKIAEAATPGVGATTPLRRKPDVDADADEPAGGTAPNMRAIAARSTSARGGAPAAIFGGDTKTQVQYASWYASKTTSPNTTAPARSPGRAASEGGAATMSDGNVCRAIWAAWRTASALESGVFP